MKNTSFFLIIFLLFSLSLVSCQSQQSSNITHKQETEVSQNRIIYEGNGIKVFELEPNTAEICVCYDWNTITDEIAYGKNNLIVTGKLSNIKDVAIEYPFMGTISTNNNTFFNVTIKKILYAADENDLKENDVILVGVPYNTYDRADEYPILEEGKEFLIFCQSTSNYERHPLYKDEYVDYWCASPETLMLERIEDYYIGQEFFRSHTENYYEYSNVEKLINDPTKGEAPIEKTVFHTITNTLYKRDLLNTASSRTAEIYTLYDCESLETAISSKAGDFNRK